MLLVFWYVHKNYVLQQFTTTYRNVENGLPESFADVARLIKSSLLTLMFGWLDNSSLCYRFRFIFIVLVCRVYEQVKLIVYILDGRLRRLLCMYSVERPQKERILRYINCTGPRSPVLPLFIDITKQQRSAISR